MKLRNVLLISLILVFIFAFGQAQTNINRSEIPTATRFYIPVGDRYSDIQNDLKWGPRPVYGGNSTQLFPGLYVDSQGNYHEGWYVYTDFNKNVNYDGTAYTNNHYHPGEDWNGNGGGDTDLGQPVYATATGKVIYTQTSSSGFGNMVQIVHYLPSGEYLLSVYAHLNSFSVNVNDLVNYNTQIGTLGKSGTELAHLHWEIRQQSFLDLSNPSTVVLKNTYPYTPTRWPGTDTQFIANNYYDPTNFIKTNDLIGKYPDGWHSDGTSQAFLTAYQRYPNNDHPNNINKYIGSPFDNGSGYYVHYWSNTNNPSHHNGVWIQDFLNTDPTTRFGTDGQTALILNETSKNAYLVKEGFWGWYKRHEGFYNLQAPTSEEMQVNSAGYIHQYFHKGYLMWAPLGPNQDWVITPVRNDGSYIKECYVDIIHHEASSTLAVENSPVTVRQEKFLKSGERLVVYHQAGEVITTPVPLSTTTSPSSLAGVEIWHGSEFLGNTPLQINAYEQFLYELTAKVNGEDVPVAFTAYDGLIVEVSSNNPSGGGWAAVQALTVNPANPAAGSDNVTLAATLENNSGSTVFYDYIELIILDNNFQSTGLRQIEFDITIPTSATWSISRIFSIHNNGEYYAAVRYSVDNVNWSYFAVLTDETNPKWFRIGPTPAPAGEIKISQFSLQNADNLEPREPHSLELQVQEILNERALYDIGIELLDENYQVVKSMTQVAYWSEVEISANSFWTGFVADQTISSAGQYYYRAQGFNHHTSLWSVLATISSAVSNPLSIQVTEDSVVQVYVWDNIPDTVAVDEKFSAWCNLQLPVGEPISYDTLGFQILDNQYNIVGMVDRKFIDHTFQPGVGLNLPIEYQGWPTPGDYFLVAAGYRAGVWQQFPAIWGVADKVKFFVYPIDTNYIPPVDDELTEKIIRLYPVKDTFYGTYYYTNGHPNYEYFWVGGWGDQYDAFLEWDLSLAPTDSIVSVYLALTLATVPTNDPDHYAYRIIEPWEENSVTQSNNPAFTYDDQVALPSSNLAQINEVEKTNITNLYLGWVEGLYPNYGLRLRPNNTDNTVTDYYSTDYADSSRWPYLEIRYLVKSVADSSSDSVLAGSYQLTNFQTAVDTIFINDSLQVSGRIKEILGYPVVIDTLKLILQDSSGNFLSYFPDYWTDQLLNAQENFDFSCFSPLIENPGRHLIAAVAIDAAGITTMLSPSAGVENPITFWVRELIEPLVPNQLQNASFETGDFSYWYVYKRFDHNAEVTAVADAHGSLVAHTLPGKMKSPYYALTLLQAVVVEAKKVYYVEFIAKADKNRKVALTLAEGNSPWRYWSDEKTVAINDRWSEYCVTLKTVNWISPSANVKLSVQLGGLNSVYIDNIRFYSEIEKNQQLGVDDHYDQEIVNIPTEFKLYQNYPNPFNPQTTIQYDLPQDTPVELLVFNLLGQKVKVLVNEYQLAGRYAVTWRIEDLSSGIYIYQLQADGYLQTKKMVFLK